MLRQPINSTYFLYIMPSLYQKIASLAFITSLLFVRSSDSAKAGDGSGPVDNFSNTLRVLSLDRSQISLGWDPISSLRNGNAQSYLLQYHEAMSNTLTTMAEQNSQTFTGSLTGFMPGHRYTFTVAPIWKSGSQGPYVDSLTLRLPGTDPYAPAVPNTPTGFAIVGHSAATDKDGSTNSDNYYLTFSWSANSDSPKGYMICTGDCLNDDSHIPSGYSTADTSYTGGVSAFTSAATYMLFAYNQNGEMSTPITATFTPSSPIKIPTVTPKATPAPTAVTTSATTPAPSPAPKPFPTLISTHSPISTAPFINQVKLAGSPVPDASRSITISTSHFTVSGITTPLATVYLTVHSTEQNYTAVADAQGNWRKDISLANLEAGEHRITAHTNTPGSEVELAHFTYDPYRHMLWYSLAGLVTLAVASSIFIPLLRRKKQVEAPLQQTTRA
jgi:hypothetical protein